MPPIAVRRRVSGRRRGFGSARVLCVSFLLILRGECDPFGGPASFALPEGSRPCKIRRRCLRRSLAVRVLRGRGSSGNPLGAGPLKGSHGGVLAPPPFGSWPGVWGQSPQGLPARQGVLTDHSASVWLCCWYPRPFLRRSWAHLAVATRRRTDASGWVADPTRAGCRPEGGGPPCVAGLPGPARVRRVRRCAAPSRPMPSRYDVRQGPWCLLACLRAAGGRAP